MVATVCRKVCRVAYAFNRPTTSDSRIWVSGAVITMALPSRRESRWYGWQYRRVLVTVDSKVLFVRPIRTVTRKFPATDRPFVTGPTHLERSSERLAHMR